MGKDYYKILGVEKNASPDEIKRAFRTLAHKHHPDKASGDEAKFKEINEAYQVLGNEQKRQQFDQFGSTFDQQGGFGGGMGWEDFMKQARGGQGFQGVNFDFGGMDLGDIFGDFFGFGGRSKNKRQARGSDLQMELQINLTEAYSGVKKTLELNKNIKCPQCHGNGAEPGTKINTCKTCGGSGTVTQVQRTFIGAFQTQAVCPECRGQGKFAEVKCKKCSGQGLIKDTVKLEIEIPAGIDNGQTLRLEGQGEVGEQSAAAGDLYINVTVKDEPNFERDGADLYSKIKIKYSQAVFGDKIEVATISGSVKLTIPEGTQTPAVFKLKNQGMPKMRGYGRGDQYVEVVIETPKNLTREQKKMIKEMGESGL